VGLSQLPFVMLVAVCPKKPFAKTVRRISGKNFFICVILYFKNIQKKRDNKNADFIQFYLTFKI
jgi:hypothetical protein